MDFSEGKLFRSNFFGYKFIQLGKEEYFKQFCDCNQKRNWVIITMDLLG